MAHLLQHQCHLDGGSRHNVSWAPDTFFSFLMSFYYTNEYQWFKFSWTYVWTWQGRKGLRHVTMCLICLFLVMFFLLYLQVFESVMPTNGRNRAAGEGQGLETGLIMWQGWCFFSSTFFKFFSSFSFSSLLLIILLPFYLQRLWWHADFISYPQIFIHYPSWKILFLVCFFLLFFANLFIIMYSLVTTTITCNCVCHSLPLSLPLGW